MSGYIISVLMGYFIGSIPSAYLLVRWKRHLDIREEGSGNVGARNTFDVTRSKGITAAVLLLDILKGVGAVLFSTALLGHTFWLAGTAGLGAIVGHNYSPWIGFKGGRGLATALGAVLTICWILAVLWASLWLLTYMFSKNIHISNAVACIVSPWIILLVPFGQLSEALAYDDGGGIGLFVFSLILCGLVLVRHVEPLRELLKSTQQPLL